MSTSTVRLTTYATGGGCATKIAQADLAGILAGLPLPLESPALLVGAHTGDDAAVYQMSDEVALVVTTDFFAPVVDDPGDYGAIAATNALSDVYAMGGTPLLALNIVAWPGEDVLPAAVLGEVLSAGADVVREAIVSNATKLEAAPPEVTAAAVAVMRLLNRDAARAAARHDVRCATDVTGFGLLGHARNIAVASRCGLEIDATSLPMLPGVPELVDAGLVPGGSRRNLAFADTWTHWDARVSPLLRIVATDAQTSGGLLLAIPAERAAALVRDIRDGGGVAEQVGRLTDDAAGTVRVRAV